MSQPATAAIIVASIFGGLAVLYFSYRAYRKIWNWRHRETLLPPIREAPTTSYHGGAVATTMIEVPSFPPFKPGSSRISFLNTPAASSAEWSQRDGLASTATSERPSPSMHALDTTVLSMPSETYDPHTRGISTVSSSSSTMTLKRSYLKSSSSNLSYISTPSRRESYLPHSPLNRESIQIVPPQPLGFGGVMTTASDQKTLAFSSHSGVGGLEEFGSGLVWNHTGDRPQQQRSRQSSRAHMADSDRRRYLMEGPSSVRDNDSRSLQSSSSTSPPSQPSLASSPAAGAQGSPHSSPVESPSMTASQVSVASQQASSSDAIPNLSVFDSKALDAQHSPLQRFQSKASHTDISPHLRLPSDANSVSTESDESPILSPFAQQFSPPRT
ncbi:hypothetical protein BCV70DRAFT_148566, partial [Testicularia cyperi]